MRAFGLVEDGYPEAGNYVDLKLTDKGHVLLSPKDIDEIVNRIVEELLTPTITVKAKGPVKKHTSHFTGK